MVEKGVMNSVVRILAMVPFSTIFAETVKAGFMAVVVFMFAQDLVATKVQAGFDFTQSVCHVAQDHDTSDALTGGPPRPPRWKGEVCSTPKTPYDFVHQIYVMFLFCTCIFVMMVSMVRRLRATEIVRAVAFNTAFPLVLLFSPIGAIGWLRPVVGLVEL